VICSLLEFNREKKDELDKICAPFLRYFDLTTFNYLRFYEDGGIFRLSNRLEWTEKYFEKKLYVGNNFYHEHFATLTKQRISQCYLWPRDQHSSLLEALYEFDIWNGITIYVKHDSFVENWGFASKRSKVNVPEIFLNNKSDLFKFIFLFKECLGKEIALYSKDNNKLLNTGVPLIDFKEENRQNKNEKSLNINIKKYFINPTTYLTKREVEVLYYLSLGKTIKECARGIIKDGKPLSPRTVEHYVNNLKSRLGCISKYDLIEAFKKSLLGQLDVGEFVAFSK